MTHKGTKGSSTCPHVDMVLLSWEEIKSKQAICHDCRKSCSRSAWLCLFQDCEFVGCGQKFADHSSKHQVQEGHSLCINLHNKRFWCTKCNAEVFEHRNRPQFVLRKFATGFEPLARSGRAAATESSSEEDPEPETLGLTGLRNLGNTCYMNAALQALSNCRQLTRFFMDCPGLAKPGKYAARTLNTPLCIAYAGVLAELWSPQRHQAVTPQLLLQSMRQAHPAFRSWAQQDSQEFLRCFMDQLHEELKRPASLSTSSATSIHGTGDEDDEGGDNVDGDGGVGGGGSALNDVDSAASASSASAAAATSSLSTAVSPVGLDGDGAGADSIAAAAAASSTGESAVVSASAGSGPGKRRARRFNSIISDIFNGSLVSTVQCNTCERLSSTLEVFQDLSLPIPSGDYLASLQKKSAVIAGGYAQQHWWITNLLTWPLSWARSFISGPRVSLQDCLAAFFSNDDLKGDNMYHCGRCGKLRNGIKYSRIKCLPEMLTVHLKRFRHDFVFSTKIGSHVAFPIEGLDMKPYLHRNFRARQTVYDLTAAVCHHGSTLGGHYTAFALNHAGMQWHEFDDAHVRPVDVTTVENCQAYVLFYRKRDEWVQPIRMKVNDIRMELQEDSSNSLMPFYISRLWINKFNTFGDPGPISNDDFLCPHRLLSPHAAECADSVAIQLPYAAWDLLLKEFGGGPTVNRLGACPDCAGELDRARKRARQELATYKRELEYFQRGSGSVYGISMRWFHSWQSFATERELEPPGQIDNSGIVLRRGVAGVGGAGGGGGGSGGGGSRLVLRTNSDYAQVSGRIWRYLLSIYGGGPEVRLESAGRASRSSSSVSDSDSDSADSGSCGRGDCEVNGSETNPAAALSESHASTPAGKQEFCNDTNKD